MIKLVRDLGLTPMNIVRLPFWLLSVRFVAHKEMPQEILSSDKAAYCPFGNTVHLVRTRFWKWFLDVPHEMGHAAAFFLGGFNHPMHRWLDGERKPM